MHLEEQSLDEIMANSELLVSCYYIIESAVSYMASDRFGQLLINAGRYDFVIWPVALKFCHRLLLLDQRQRGQLYTALKNGFTSILGFLQVSTFDPKTPYPAQFLLHQELSMTLKEQPHHLESHQKKYFVCATIR